MLAATPRRTRYRLSPVFVSAFLRRVQPLVLQCFVDGWEEGLAIAELKATVRDYFGDFRKFLTKFFFDRLALLMMGKVCGLPIYYRTMVCAHGPTLTTACSATAFAAAAIHSVHPTAAGGCQGEVQRAAHLSATGYSGCQVAVRRAVPH